MPTRLTTLDAVNLTLRMLGRMPVSSLAPADLTPDAIIAQAEIEHLNKQVQLTGWQFNTEYSVVYVPDVNGEVLLGDDIARVDNAKRRGPGQWGFDLVMRVDPDDSEMKLFDKLAASREEDGFDLSAAAKVWIDQVRLLDYEATPDAFRHYIAVRAGRNVQARLISDPALYRFSLDDEARALQVLQKEELDTSDANMLNAPGVRQIVRRRSPLDSMESL